MAGRLLFCFYENCNNRCNCYNHLNDDREHQELSKTLLLRKTGLSYPFVSWSQCFAWLFIFQENRQNSLTPYRGIRNELLFPITERAVQKHLKTVCCYLGISGVSTHSFRKYGATEIYKNNGYDIALVQRLLQHSSVSVSQAYIGIEPQRIEEAILGHTQLL